MDETELIHKLKTIFHQEKKNLNQEKRIYSFEKLEKEEPKQVDWNSQSVTVDPYYREFEDCEVRFIPGKTKLNWKSYDILTKLYTREDTQGKKFILDTLIQVVMDSNPIDVTCYPQGYINNPYKSPQVQQHFKTAGFLALYFLMKHNNTSNVIRQLNLKGNNYIAAVKGMTKKSQRTTTFKGGDDFGCYLDGILDFIEELKPNFTSEDFTILKDHASYCSHSLAETLTQIEFDNLEDELNEVKLDIEEYREEVVQYIKDFNFDAKLAKAINKAYDKIRDELNDDPSGEINKLREFFKNLIFKIGDEIATINRETKPRREEAFNQYLILNLELTEEDIAMIKSLRGVQHVEGGHTLFTERKYGILVLNLVLSMSYFLLESYNNFKKNN